MCLKEGGIAKIFNDLSNPLCIPFALTTHQWVLDEMGGARSNSKKAIGRVEQDVDIGGMYKSHELIPLDKADPIHALMRLSDTIGLWTKELGRTVKVQILPDTVAKRQGSSDNRIKCQHRLWLRGAYSDWKYLTPVPEAGGTFVFVNGVQDDYLFQVQIQHYIKDSNGVVQKLHVDKSTKSDNVITGDLVKAYVTVQWHTTTLQRDN
ncbi:MAG TPA: hypothetical protein VN647_06500 [Nitrospira sp.]|nr:hypothetical protein [Nitrospira sp.]